jgi:hypothetical protein
VFIPGNAVHSVEATGQTDLRVVYVLAADAFEDVEYIFAEKPGCGVPARLDRRSVAGYVPGDASRARRRVSGRAMT